MSEIRKVLLADPVFFGHSLLYYRAALASTGFENARFTIAAAVHGPANRARFEQFGRDHPQASMRLLDTDPGNLAGRWNMWRGFWGALREIENFLRAETFDLIAILNLDLALVFFAFSPFKPMFRAHYRAKLAGTILRDNGLRPPLRKNLKGRVRAATDRWILRRALLSGAFRKVAFLDHWCADRARESLNCEICDYGVDPVFPRAYDPGAARARFGLQDEDFVFLLFGTLSHRKGIVESLAMLRQANLPTEETAILVAGPVDPPYREVLAEALALTENKYRLIRHDRFIEDHELPPYLAAADCVLCIYNEFSGSSNVLLQASVFGKAALVSRGGAMEDAIRRYQFGDVVSFDRPDEFTVAVRKLAGLSRIELGRLGERARQYAVTMDARRYMSQFV